MGLSPGRIGRAGLVGLAVTAIGAGSCDLVLDIGSLDRGHADGGSPDGGNPDGGSPDSGDADSGSLDASLDGGNPVEVIATGQCYPGDITLADGFVYWDDDRRPERRRVRGG